MGCVVGKNNIDKFIEKWIEDRYSLKILGKGANKIFYRFNNNAFTVVDGGKINEIYERLSTLSDDEKKYILLPSNIKKISLGRSVYQFDLCEGDLADPFDIYTTSILEDIRNNIEIYQKQFDNLINVVKKIHSLNIHTLDIKPDNMLLCKDTIKLTDFDSACIDNEGDGAFTVRYVGDLKYNAKDNDLLALYISIIDILYKDVWKETGKVVVDSYTGLPKDLINNDSRLPKLILHASKKIRNKTNDTRKRYASRMIEEIKKIYKKNIISF